MTKVGRNDPCPCGSGKKFKKCCLNKEKHDGLPSYKSIDDEIIEASKLAIEHDEKSILSSINKLNELQNRKGLKPSQKQNILLNLVTAYQHRGEHAHAVETLNKIADDHFDNCDDTFHLICNKLAATSYTALGLLDDACSLFDEIIDKIKTLTINELMLGAIYLEAGKSYCQNQKTEKAMDCWEKALNIFSNQETEVEHFARAKANLGFLLLNQNDETEQKVGIKQIEESTELKKLVGDLEGIANNHANLGLYCWKHKHYERAIAFTRRGLFLSKKVGNLRSIASTLGNLSAIYADMKQLTSARKVLKEAEAIGKSLNDAQLLAITKHNLNHINKIGKEAGRKKEVIGPAAQCACGSGKEYQECCGQADFEPIDISIEFGGVSEELSAITDKIIAAGGEPSRLDFIFRDTKQTKRRFAWSRMKINDGWLEMRELPDMANHHLISAEILAGEAHSEPDSITKPLSCLILCVCALEAFINQVAYFLNEIKSFPESKLYEIPQELSEDAMAFQRHTELTVKWNILGDALCGEFWPPPTDLWNDFRNLIYVRNELIHFKVGDYEQVVPPPKKPHMIMQKIPSSVETRAIPHAWPSRLLTPSFAKWCIDITESMIHFFKNGYNNNRLNISNTAHE